MTCEVTKSDGVVRIRGDMTIYCAAELKQHLFAALDAQSVVCTLDLAEVTELDMTGLQILLVALKACAARGAALALKDPSEIVRDTLALVGVQNAFAAREAAA